MREIMFRGKCVNTGKWYYGQLLEDRERCAIVTDARIYGEGFPWVKRVYEVNTATVGQYTSLKDKNGAWIYEGDIVQFFPRKEKSEVKFNDGAFVYYKSVRISFNSDERELREDLLINLLTDHEYQNHCEVIGNIYGNPELLQSTIRP